VTEECAVCGDTTPFGDAIHLLIHTQSDEGVVDRYVCRRCYESDVQPLFED